MMGVKLKKFKLMLPRLKNGANIYLDEHENLRVRT